MKYNEAIDMILDGGEVYRNSVPEYKYFFDQSDSFLYQSVDGLEGNPICRFDKGDFKGNDWIVEKDGVVYEEYCTFCPDCKEAMGNSKMWPQYWICDNNDCAKNNFNPDLDAKMNKYFLFTKDRPHNQDEPAEAVVYERYECRNKKMKINRRVLIGLDDIKAIYTKVQKKCDLYHADQAASKIMADILSEWIVCQPDAPVFIKDRIQEQDEPAELEEGGKPWEEIKMPIIADEVNEDWLEKKMSCFLGRNFECGSNYVAYFKLQDKCGGNKKCPFCFPQEQPKEDLIKKTIRDMKPIHTAKEASENTVKAIMEEANKVLEQPREKVTVEGIIDIIKEFGKSSIYNSNLLKRIEYLVSLQEK